MTSQTVKDAASNIQSHGQRKLIAQAALLVMIGNISSRVLGMVREQVIAGFFGGGSVTDAFVAANSVPTTFYDLLIGGMISAALVPVFTSYSKEQDEAELWKLVSIVLNVASLGLAISVAALVLCANPLIGFYGIDLGAEDKALAAALLRLMLPSVFLMGISGILSAFLYSRQRFLLPAFCITAYNASMIVATVLLHDRIGVYSLAVGMLVGATFQIVLQMPGMRGFRYRRAISLSHPDIRRIGRLYLPIFLGLIVSGINIAIDRNLASRTGEGSLAAMRFATTVTQFPLGLIASALGLALLPALSTHAHQELEDTTNQDSDRGEREGQGQGFKATLALGIRMTVLLIVPAAVGLVILREPLIRLLFQHGVFKPSESARTATAFLAYAPGLPAAAVDQLIIFAFYARRNTLTPALVGIAGVACYLIVALLLLEPLGMPGLALANSAQWIGHMLIMLYLLRRLIGSMAGLGIGAITAKAAGAAAVMALAVFLGGVALQGALDGGSTAKLLAAVVFLGTMGMLVYGLAVIALRVSEVQILWQMTKSKLARG